MLKEETASVITLIQPNGETTIVKKSDVDEEIKQSISPMPSFDRLLTDQQVADITTWLLSQREKTSDKR